MNRQRYIHFSICLLLALLLVPQPETYADTTGNPAWKGTTPVWEKWASWATSSLVPVVATTTYPETVQLALAEATDTAPAYLYSLHQVKPSSSSVYRGIVLTKRNWKDGNLVTSFGASGILTEMPANKKYLIKSLNIGSDGYLYVTIEDDATSHILVEKRSPDTGSLVSAFDGDGIRDLGAIDFQKTVPLAGTDGFLVITKGTDKYTATRYSYSTGASVGSYTITNETELQNFGTYLKKTSFGDAVIYNGDLYMVINIQNFSLFPTGYDSKYKITRKAALSGTAVWEYTNTNGIFSKEQASSIAVDSTDIYLAGANTSGLAMFNSSQNFVRKHSLTDGSLNTSWGLSGGSVSIPFLDFFFGTSSTIENISLKIYENTLYLLHNGTTSYSLWFWQLSSSSAATISRINKTTGVPDATFADAGTAKVAKGKFPYFLLDKWGALAIIGSDSSYTGDYTAKLGFSPIPYGLIDIGIRQKTATGIVTIAAEPAGYSSSPVRIRRNGVTYSLPLVEFDSPNAANIRVESPLGAKSLTKYQ